MTGLHTPSLVRSGLMAPCPIFIVSLWTRIDFHSVEGLLCGITVDLLTVCNPRLRPPSTRGSKG